MKIVFSQVLRLTFVLIISAVSAFALENSAIENYRSNVVRDNDGKVQKYSVLVATVGNPKTNSDFSEHFIQRVDPKYYVRGQIYVKTKAKTDKGTGEILQGATALNAALQSIGSTKITAFADAKKVAKNPGMQKYGLDRIYTVNIPLDRDPFEVCAELMSNPDVEYACPVSVHYSNSVKPNDPSIMKQYTLDNMGVFEAWEYSKGGHGIKIAIVDSGVDYNHPDLAENIWTNPNEIPDDGIDNDGNGKIDDVRGWDFVANKDINRINNWIFDEDNDPMNTVNTHGTMVSGCAGAVTNNSEGIAGVAYNCKIIPIKAGSDLEGVTGLYQTTSGIIYATELGADIINCSYGGIGYNPVEQDIINYAVLEKNIVIVAAAGNNTMNNDDEAHFPASYNNVLSVGATNNANEMTDFSNYGYCVATFAPGERVLTTDAGGVYREVNGTSFSSPNVSGLVALVKAVHPDWTAKQIYHQIRSTSDRVSGNGEPYEFYGLANALKAVTWNSEYSDITVPGIGIEKYHINSDTNLYTVNDSKEFDITFVLKNHLSSTDNLNIKLYSPNGEIEVLADDYNLLTFVSGTTQSISFRAKLSDKNPWSEGYAKMVLEYQGENGRYSDYQMIKLPIKVKGDANIAMTDYRRIGSSSHLTAPNNNDVWSVVFSRNKLRTWAHLIDFSKLKDKYFFINEGYYPSAAGCNNEDALYFAMYNYDKCKIYKKIPHNDNLNSTDVSNITSKVNAIYFIDNMNGVFLGNSKLGKWGIATTTNGGSTWNAIDDAPNSDGVGIQSNAHELVNNTIYFGSRRGAILKSDDWGFTWNAMSSVTGVVHAMAFLNEETGLIIHNFNTSERTNGTAYISRTTDGGATWDISSVIPIKKLGVYPQNIYANRTSGYFILVNSDGSVYKSFDLGQSWQPMRKRRTSIMYNSTLYDDGNGNTALFINGESVQRLQIKLEEIEVVTKPIFKFRQGSKVNLDSIALGESKSVVLNIDNKGDGAGKIASYNIKVTKGDEDEFEILNLSNAEITPNKSIAFTVKHTPKTEGRKEAEITVKYNDTTISIKVTAIAYKIDTRGTLSMAMGTILDYGSMEENTKQTKVVTISNNTKHDVKVFNVKIKPAANTDDVVTLKGSKQVTIKANSYQNFTFEFSPTSIGKKLGYVEIVNDGKINPLQIIYSAYVYKSANAPESSVFANAKLIPNPATNSCQLFLGDDASKVETMEIYSADGRLVMQIPPTFNDGSTTINTSSLPIGQYNIVLSGSGIRETLKLIVVR